MVTQQYPHQSEKLDPDPHESENPDKDPHESDGDPQPCFYTLSCVTFYITYMVFWRNVYIFLPFS